MARCLKIKSKLPTTFWNYFIWHVIHIINRTLTPLLDNISPFEKLFGKSPDYAAMKTFGCLVFVSTLYRDRTKFQDRAENGIFLGYENGMKGYKVYCLERNKFLVSRNVRFVEHVFPYNDYDINENVDNGKKSSSEKNTENEDCEVNVEGNSNKPPRTHKQPSYLRDYHFSLRNTGSIANLEDKKVHPVSKVLNYDRLSQEHKAYSLAISTDSEPKTYFAASKCKEWQEAMNLGYSYFA